MHFYASFLFVVLYIVALEIFSYIAITNDTLILKGTHRKTEIEFKKIRYIYVSSNKKSFIIPVSLQFSDGRNKIALTSLSQNYRELIQNAVSKTRELSDDCKIEKEVDILLKEWNK